MSFSNNVQNFDKALSLLGELSTSWGASSAETRKLATLRIRSEAEAKALEEIAQALVTEGKTPEELAQSYAYLKKSAPSVPITKLEGRLESLVDSLKNNLIDALDAEDAAKAASCALVLDKCDRGNDVEEIFEQARAWQVLTYKDWCIEARKERQFALRTMPTHARANTAFDRAAIASIREFAEVTLMQEDDERRRASKVKSLGDFLPELKEACGSSQRARAEWDAAFVALKALTLKDAETCVTKHSSVRWSSSFHGIDPACLEVFGLLVRAGLSSDPPQQVLVALIERLRESMRGREQDLFVLLGCCNSLDYILGYLDEYTPERNRAVAMLRGCKEGFVKKACTELEKNGENFVKQSARYFQVQNPVLRTELRLEVSKAWKSANIAKKHSQQELGSSMVGEDSFSTGSHSTTTEVGGVVALFFEGPAVEGR